MTFKYKSNLNVIISILFLFSLSDLSIYYFGNILTVFCVTFVSVITFRYKSIMNIKIDVLSYFIVISILFVICLLISGEWPNFVVLSPLFSIVLFYFLNRNKNMDVKIILDSILKSITLILLIVCAIELSTKMNVHSFHFMKDFIENFGDKRIDVLRCRAIFGSSLSLVALAVLLFFYFFNIRKNIAFSICSVILILFSGSRTGIVLVAITIIISCMKSILLFRLNNKILPVILTLLCVSTSFFLISPFINDDILRIFSRSFQIVNDASFSGRQNTTVSTFLLILNDFPNTLFSGLKESFVSDSAIVSIMAGSGIIITLTFLFYFIYCLNNSTIDFFSKKNLILISILGALTIGDYFIPFVSVIYFTILYTYRYDKNL